MRVVLEHPHLYRRQRADSANLLAPDRFPSIWRDAGRLHLSRARPARRLPDARFAPAWARLRKFVRQVEGWILAALAEFNVQACILTTKSASGFRAPNWGNNVRTRLRIGLRVRRWVSFHGLALNVEPDLDHFSGIVPCGIADRGVTSLVDLGLPVGLEEADRALLKNFDTIFGSISETITQIPE
ncbi:MAG: octanoyltransferase [Hyphomicrobiales bacterium]|nr:MAG: octanoyltransferase [Hyphomicrobiales bacterium]